MKEITLKIEGMSCSACQNRIEKYLNKQEGIKAEVNLVMASAKILYDEKKVSLKEIDNYIEQIGYKSLGPLKNFEEKKDNSKIFLIIFSIYLIFYLLISNITMHYLQNEIYGIILFVISIPYFFYGYDILLSGIKKLIHKSFNMDTLVTIGVLTSFLYSTVILVFNLLNKSITNNYYFESSIMILYFIKLGRYIDKNAKGKTKEAIKELVQITPKTALIKKSDEVIETTIDEVKKGDILICKPGMKIAVDGIITKGITHINESFITGESIPSKKQVSDNVITGSINIDGYIEYKALRIGPDSSISEIIKLVNESILKKAPIGKLADKVSGYFVPIIILIAILTFTFSIILGNSLNDSITSFISVLVISCPCALGLATPLAMVASIGNCAKHGILIKTSEILENANKIDTIIFDKTGTLTNGKLSISKIYTYSNYKEKDILEKVASLEHLSTHPIASAFKDYYNKKIIVKEFKNIEGIGIKGVHNKKEIYIGNNKLFSKLKIKNEHMDDENKLLAKGNSILYVIEERKVIALIGVCDIIRDNAKDTIQKLKNLKKDIVLLSGDSKEVANLIGKELNIDMIKSSLIPQEKSNFLNEMKKNHKVMMVGDGINDSLALINSDVGVSIKSGTDIAGDSADVILMNDDLSKIITLINISKKTITIIKQNLFWAFFYNLCMIPIAMGLLKPIGISINPVLSSIAMTISSLSVVLNSLRLK